MTMEVGLCYESVLPARGGCEHYISDLARRLARDGHGVHLFGCWWDGTTLPPSIVIRTIPAPTLPPSGGLRPESASTGPRFLRPWRFAPACEQSLKAHPLQLQLGFSNSRG